MAYWKKPAQPVRYPEGIWTPSSPLVQNPPSAIMMMMSLNSKQHFSMVHSSLQDEAKYSALHSSSPHSSSSATSSPSISSVRSSAGGGGGGGSANSSSSSSSEAMRRACLPTPPVCTLHNHRSKAHLDSPLYLLDVFFMSAQQITQHIQCFPPFPLSPSLFCLNLCIQSVLPFILIFMTWDVACILCSVCLGVCSAFLPLSVAGFFNILEKF